MKLFSFVDFFPFTPVRRAHEAFVDAEAISLIRSAKDDETAYQQARQVMRLARERGDFQAAKLYTRIAIRISEVTGRQIGPSDAVGERYQEPTRRIDADKTVRR
jgi:hypothetical protein